MFTINSLKKCAIIHDYTYRQANDGSKVIDVYYYPECQAHTRQSHNLEETKISTQLSLDRVVRLFRPRASGYARLHTAIELVN